MRVIERKMENFFIKKKVERERNSKEEGELKKWKMRMGEEEWERRRA
jgi:hypothetical protein